MIHLNFHQNWWHRKKQNWKELLSPELVIFSSLKKSPISSNHQNFHQNWWHKKPNIGRNYCHQNWWHFCHSRTHQLLQFTKIFTKIGDKKKLKIGRNYCHQNWWHFRHSRTHQFLQFTKIFTKIGEKLGENSVENSIHQNVHQNWWQFWRKCTRKWVPYPTSLKEHTKLTRTLANCRFEANTQKGKEFNQIVGSSKSGCGGEEKKLRKSILLARGPAPGAPSSSVH